jgi:hypothetical protein
MRIPAKKVFIHGFIITAALVTAQLILDAAQNSFLRYLPPLGFAFFIVISYIIQPLIIGVLNIVVLQRLYNYESWQIGFWLNGLFLMLAFAAINLALQTIAHVPFSILVAIVELPLLAYPFGYLGKFSNRGCQTKTQE